MFHSWALILNIRYATTERGYAICLYTADIHEIINFYLVLVGLLGPSCLLFN